MITDFNSFILRPVQADFFENHNKIFKEDPYVQITIGDKKFKTRVDKHGGLHPHWSDSFTLEGLGNAMAIIQVYDKDTLLPDNLLGEALFSLNGRFFGEQSRQKMDLFSKDKRVGEITLEFKPSGTDIDTTHKICGLTGVQGEKEYPITQKDMGFMDTIKKDIGILGEKVGFLGEKIEGALGLGHKKENPHHLEASAPVEPVKGDDLAQTPGLNEEYSGVRPILENAPSHNIDEHGNIKPNVLDKSNSEYFGEDEDTTKLQGQEFHKIDNLAEERLDVGEQKLGEQQGLAEEIRASGLGETVKDFSADLSVNTDTKPAVDNRDDWSVTSNQGSVLDKSDIPASTFMEQGKEKLTELTQKAQNVFAGNPNSNEPGLMEKSKETLHNMGEQIKGTFASNESSEPGLLEKGKQKLNELGHSVTDVFSDRSHIKPNDAADKPLPRPHNTVPTIPEEQTSPDLMRKAKEEVSSFGTEANSLFSSDKTTLVRGPSAEQAGGAEGPKDIDIVDVGPQDFSIDKKFNSEDAYKDRETVENDALISRSNELQKEGIFDQGFESQKLSQKAESLREEGFFDQSTTLNTQVGLMDKGSDKLDNPQPAIVFDNKDTKGQFMSANIGLNSEKPAQDNTLSDEGHLGTGLSQ